MQYKSDFTVKDGIAYVKGSRKVNGQHLVFLIDECNIDLVCTRKWQISKKLYVSSTIKGKTVYLHHLILPLSKKDKQNKLSIDHKDRNPLNNTICNLRKATASEQNRNRNSYGNVKFRGVFLQKNGKYRASIYYQGKSKSIGIFNSAIQAAKAYNAKALQLYKNPFINKIDTLTLF